MFLNRNIFYSYQTYCINIYLCYKLYFETDGSAIWFHLMWLDKMNLIQVCHRFSALESKCSHFLAHLSECNTYFFPSVDVLCVLLPLTYVSQFFSLNFLYVSLLFVNCCAHLYLSNPVLYFLTISLLVFLCKLL